MKKLLLLVNLLVVFAACAPRQAQEQEEVARPNVVLILADDLGINDISCYRAATSGQPELAPTCQTPNIDRLASQGMRFTDFYAGAAVCSPSRAALLTGRNTTRVGIYNWIPPGQPMHLRASEVTIAEMLKKQGYQTGHFGKWHLTSQGMGQPLPNQQGFDYSFFTCNNANPSHLNPVNFFRNGEAVGELQGYACQLVADEALQWLQQRDPERPFYLNLWFNEPHVKLAAPEELTAQHSHKPEYYGAIENMDLAVGRVQKFLKENGLAENTIIIFTSDNGSQEAYSNFPLRGQKAFNFEGGVREPFLVQWPGQVPAGKISRFPGSFTDVLPTLASLTGTAVPDDRQIDGADISPVFLGMAESVERETPIFFYRYFHDPVCMLRKGDWCLLGFEEPWPEGAELDTRKMANLKPVSPDLPPWSEWGFKQNHMEYIKNQQITAFELYNLAEDPGQRRNIAAGHPEMVEKMKAEMLRLRQQMLAEGGDWYTEE